MIEFYWNLGKDISEKYPGKKRNIAFFANLSRDLCSGMSDISGLSERNIRYSLAFYELYSYLQQVVADNELIVSQSVEQSDRRKRVTSKVPQVVANCYRQQVFDVADVFRPLGPPLSGSSSGSRSGLSSGISSDPVKWPSWHLVAAPSLQQRACGLSVTGCCRKWKWIGEN